MGRQGPGPAVCGRMARGCEPLVDFGEGSNVYDVYGNSYLDFAEAASVMDIVYNCQKVRMPMHQMEKRWITGIGIYPWRSE